eukprot:6181682-Pleurochrysis_carterae.AAC.2
MSVSCHLSLVNCYVLHRPPRNALALRQSEQVAASSGALATATGLQHWPKRVGCCVLREAMIKNLR